MMEKEAEEQKLKVLVGLVYKTRNRQRMGQCALHTCKVDWLSENMQTSGSPCVTSLKSNGEHKQETCLLSSQQTQALALLDLVKVANDSPAQTSPQRTPGQAGRNMGLVNALRDKHCTVTDSCAATRQPGMLCPYMANLHAEHLKPYLSTCVPSKSQHAVLCFQQHTHGNQNPTESTHNTL